MKLNPKVRFIIVVSIGLTLILFGVAQAIFKFQLPKKIVDEVSFFLMLMAFGLILSGRKKETPPTEPKIEEEKETEDKEEQ